MYIVVYTNNSNSYYTKSFKTNEKAENFVASIKTKKSTKTIFPIAYKEVV